MSKNKNKNKSPSIPNKQDITIMNQTVLKNSSQESMLKKLDKYEKSSKIIHSKQRLNLVNKPIVGVSLASIN